MTMTITDHAKCGLTVCGQCRSEVAMSARLCSECGASLRAGGARFPSRWRKWAATWQSFLFRAFSNVAFWAGGPIFVVMLLRFAVAGRCVPAGLIAAEIARSLWVLTMLERRLTRITSARCIALHLGATTLVFLCLEWCCTAGLSSAHLEGSSTPEEYNWVSYLVPLAVHLPPCLAGVIGLTFVWRLREADRNRAALFAAVGVVLVMTVVHAASAWAVLPVRSRALLTQSLAQVVRE